MRRFLGVTLAAIIAGLAAVPAGAAGDDVTLLKAKMKAASANVRSVQTRMSSQMGMSGVTTTVNKPLRSHSQMASGPIAMEMYFADGFLYQRIGNGAWQRHSMPSPDSMLGMAQTFSDSIQMRLDPDVTEDSRTYGSFDVQMGTAAIPGAPPAPAMKMTCTYDKQTFLTHDCKNGFFTLTFRYNDPGDVVVLPPDAAAAVDAGPLLLPMPSAPQTSATPDPASAALPDRAVSLVGAWSCESIRHSTGTWTYTRGADDSIAMKNVFRTVGGLSGEFDDTYRFDVKTGRWSWTSSQANRPGSLEENGVAPRWTGDKWTFEGREIVTEPPAAGGVDPNPHTLVLRLRSVYTSLGTDAFRREFERFNNGTWVTGSASTCKRVTT